MLATCSQLDLRAHSWHELARMMVRELCIHARTMHPWWRCQGWVCLVFAPSYPCSVLAAAAAAATSADVAIEFEPTLYIYIYTLQCIFWLTPPPLTLKAVNVLL